MIANSRIKVIANNPNKPPLFFLNRPKASLKKPTPVSSTISWFSWSTFSAGLNSFASKLSILSSFSNSNSRINYSIENINRQIHYNIQSTIYKCNHDNNIEIITQYTFN